MQSTITSRGQTVVPAAIRKQFNLTPSDRLEWIVDDEGIRVIPVKQDPVVAFRGQGQGGSACRLIVDRQRDRERE